MYEVELHYPATPDSEAVIVVQQVEASCPTELANIAYGLQMRSGYRSVKKLNGKTKIVGLMAEYVSFGPVIPRNEDGTPLYGHQKTR